LITDLQEQGASKLPRTVSLAPKRDQPMSRGVHDPEHRCILFRGAEDDFAAAAHGERPIFTIGEIILGERERLPFQSRHLGDRHSALNWWWHIAVTTIAAAEEHERK